MDFSVIADNGLYLLIGAWPHGPIGGAALTLLLTAASALASGVLGLLAGVGLSLLPAWARALLLPVLGFFRAIPVIMLIFWIYFLLPIAFGIDAPAIGTVVIALSLIGGAYLAHAVHAGIRSLPRGQSLAAQALGLTRLQTMRRVILPQALPMMLPSFINQWVALTKDTSLAYVIGVAELSFVATQVSNRTMVYPLEIYLCVAAMYFVFCSTLQWLATRLSAIYAGQRALPAPLHP